jgi:hypothetical protein
MYVRCSAEKNQINNNEGDNDSDEAKTKHIADIVSDYALARATGGKNGLLRGRSINLLIDLLIFRRSCIGAHRLLAGSIGGQPAMGVLSSMLLENKSDGAANTLRHRFLRPAPANLAGGRDCGRFRN